MNKDDELLDSLVVINKISDGITVSDKRGYFEIFNVRMQKITGYSISEANQVDDFNALIHPGQQDWQDILQSLHEITKGKGCLEAETVIRAKDGSEKTLLISTSLIRYKKTDMFLSVWRDITDRKRAQEELRKSEINLRQAQEIARLGRWDFDLITGRLILSEGAFSLFEINAENTTFSFKVFVDFIHPDDRAFVERAYRESIVKRKPYELQHRLLMKDGRIKWVSEIGRTEYDDANRPIRFIGTIQDVTEHKLLEQKLFTMAHCDALTQLPNRTFFLEEANLEISRARRTGMQCAILFVDLDHFKNVNDTLGHSLGDELLKDTAQKLMTCIRQTDIIARLGGDEFIIFLNIIESGQDAQYIAERIREKFNASRIIAGNDLFITVSIGIAVYPGDGDSLEDLLKNADTAMYVAKQSGRNMFRFFDSEMNKKAVAKMQVERGLRDALGKNEFTLFYQPIVNVSDGKIRGFEALLRWFKTEGELVLPDQFISVAEDTGLIVPIGEWVIHEACRFNKEMVDAGYTDMVMSVNISVAQLRRKGLVDIIKSALSQSGLRPELLEVEVTESLFIESFDAAIEILNGIRSLGVQVSLDDFGTGYSSLVHLQKLPIVNLKIDRLFIKEIAKDSDENAMIPTIIDLAHKVKLGVVAEGVETQHQLEKLLGNNCDYYQGYLFSKPIPSDQVIALLARIRNT